MSNMLIALQITALGMGLVFAAIVLLWWMMALLTNIAADKDTSSRLNGAAPVSSEHAPVMESDIRAQAAAVGVAMALAEQQAAHAHALSDPPTAIVSAWQLGMRTRQMYQKGRPIARSPRKVG